jgi:ADP-ribosylation factor protein 6
MDFKEVAEALQLQKLKDRVWNVQPSTATNGAGLEDGLKWLSDNVKDTPLPGKK